ncbi:NAD(P)-binding protein [Rhizophagus irregularis]|uniref:NAD(P)-binding protein n=1 Tax=Rhizophagus irregularis TaxID=588596 RepID=A0A2N0R8D8_9GLOM|nr:NAD(P)-binding protein [Rhizophagus irregularis]PKC59570.1 NAD(P)-binding protein [Rhizophagus irregularis]
MPVKLSDNYDLSKHVIILTGATDGIGKEMAKILFGFNPKRLILPARNKEKGNKLLEYLKSFKGHTDNVEIWEMDLADLQSVKTFANKFINEVGELHMLINNAGIETKRQILKTKDNLELQFQNILICKELGRMLQNDHITTYSHHPGVILTNIAHLNTGFSISTFIINTLSRLNGITAEQGATNVLYPEFSLENKETGKYFDEGIEQEPNKIADDQEIAKKLWSVSEQMLKERGMI